MGKISTFSDRLKEVLTITGFKAADLSRSTGISQSSLSHYLKGDWEGKQDAVYLIANALGISEAWLMGYDVPMSRASNTDNSPANILPLPKTKRIPLLGTIACGEPITATENIDQYIEVADDIQCTFALRCKGDSMVDARIMDGDVVYIREQPQVENGEIAAVLIEDEATLKRVYLSEGVVQLVPCNAKYSPMVYTGAQLDTIRILGKAVAFTSLVR